MYHVFTIKLKSDFEGAGVGGGGGGGEKKNCICHRFNTYMLHTAS